MEELNRTRKEMQAALSQEVIERAGALGPTSEAPVAFLAGEGWHQGLVGIVAARVAETLHRPAFIAHIEGDEAVGSVRSVPGVDALEILRGAEGIYTKGGGHAAAALLQRFSSAAARGAPPNVICGCATGTAEATGSAAFSRARRSSACSRRRR